MKIRKRGFLKHKRGRDVNEVELQITSLADILIVVLIFLLKSVSSNIDQLESISIPQNVALPSVSSGGSAEDGLKVEVNESEVKIAGRVVARLRDYRFPTDDLNQDLEQGGTSKAMQKMLYEGKEKQAGDHQSVWILADQKAPYATIQTVLASVAIFGYSDFKLAVLRSED